MKLPQVMTNEHIINSSSRLQSGLIGGACRSTPHAGIW